MNTRTIDENIETGSAIEERGYWLTSSAQRYRKRLLWRGLFMLAALLVYSVAELLAKATVVVHWVFAMVAGRPSLRLLAAGDRLSGFIYQLWRYLLLCDETPPWPLNRWPYERFGD